MAKTHRSVAPGPVVEPVETTTHLADQSTPDSAGASSVEIVAMLAGFGERLRAREVNVGTGDLLTYTAAAAALDTADLVDLYWAGRTSLITRREQIPVYDAVFREYFLHEPADHDPARSAVRARAATAQAVLEIPSTDSRSTGGDEQEAELGRVGSPARVSRHKSFEQCTPAELAAMRRIIAGLRVTPPRRRVRRTEPAGRTRHHRRVDARRTVRAQLRAQLAGEPDPLRWKRRQVRVRPLVLLLDVSGSMSDYSRNLVQFAHAAGRAAAGRSGRVEVFCFGTRLTRITPALRRRSPDAALARAAARVLDWEGGTQIGSSLDTFIRRWGRGGMARRAIVVIASDGLDRGDPAVLASALERLARLAHRVVWMNPHAQGGRTPPTVGMLVAEPFIDELLAADDLAGLERFAGELALLG